MKVSSLEVEGCDGNVSSLTFTTPKGSLFQLPSHKKVQRESMTTREPRRFRLPTHKKRTKGNKTTR
jgi:hypothetical protein